MKYLLLICGDESAAAHADEGCGGWTEDLAERGMLQLTGGLAPPEQAKTVRVRRRQLMLSDGPFAETKEQLAGYYLIDVPDLDAALSWAARCPAAGSGTVEVRPVWVM